MLEGIPMWPRLNAAQLLLLHGVSWRGWRLAAHKGGGGVGRPVRLRGHGTTRGGQLRPLDDSRQFLPTRWDMRLAKDPPGDALGRAARGNSSRRRAVASGGSPGPRATSRVLLGDRATIAANPSDSAGTHSARGVASSSRSSPTSRRAKTLTTEPKSYKNGVFLHHSSSSAAILVHWGILVQYMSL